MKGKRVTMERLEGEYKAFKIALIICLAIFAFLYFINIYYNGFAITNLIAYSMVIIILTIDLGFSSLRISIKYLVDEWRETRYERNAKRNRKR